MHVRRHHRFQPPVGFGPLGVTDDGGGGTTTTDATAAATVEPDKGYPEGTPVADMTPQQQAAYYRAQSRKWEDQARGKAEPTTDYLKGIKAQADQLEQARRDAESEQEKAIREAVEKAVGDTRTATLREVQSDTVQALLKGALKARGVTNVDDHIARTNLAAFVKDGDIDHDALVAHANTLAGTGAGGSPDLGLGRRGTTKTGTRPGSVAQVMEDRRAAREKTKTTTS